jgi:hypothetical protein
MRIIAYKIDNEDFGKQFSHAVVTILSGNNGVKVEFYKAGGNAPAEEILFENGVDYPEYIVYDKVTFIGRDVAYNNLRAAFARNWNYSAKTHLDDFYLYLEGHPRFSDNVINISLTSNL